MNRPASLEEVVQRPLAEMSIPASSPLIHTLALREGRLVAEKFHYDEGCAVWAVGSDAVEFYDREGTLLKTVAVALAEQEEAA